MLLKTPAVQSWLGKKAAQSISRELATRVEVGKVSFSLLDRLTVGELLILDQQNDTLLYTQRLEVRFTDWFFLKDKVDLNRIELDDARVRLQRTDSTWRHQFLLDYLSGKNKTPNKKSHSSPLRLHELHIRALRVDLMDRWEGYTLQTRMERADLVAEKLTSDLRTIHIRSLQVDQPQVVWRQITARTPRSNATSASQASFMPHLLLDNVNIQNGRLEVIRVGRQLKSGLFDPLQPSVSDLNLQLLNTSVRGDTLQTKLSVQAKERSGFTITRLRADLEWMPGVIGLDSFSLTTANSHLEHQTRIRFSSWEKLSDFQEGVTLESKIGPSTISSKDMAYFFPEAALVNQELKLQAQVNGNLSSLTLTETHLTLGKASIFKGDILLKNLTSPQQVWMDLRAKQLFAPVQDLFLLMPGWKSQKGSPLSTLNYIQFQGSITGQPKEFATRGSWQTGWGSLAANLNVRIPDNNPFECKGTIELHLPNLGALLDNNQLGLLHFKGDLEAKGTNLADAVATLAGDISELGYNDYTYRKIKLKGSWDHQVLHLTAGINDEHLQTGPLDVTLAGGGAQNNLILAGYIHHADLQKLGFTRDPVSLSGELETALQITEPESLKAQLGFRHAAVSFREQPLPLDSLHIAIESNSAYHNISLASNEFNAGLSGRFQLNEIGRMAGHFLAAYYPSQFPGLSTLSPHTQINFLLQTSLAEPLLSTLAPEWSGLNYSTVEAHWLPDENKFDLKATIPDLGYRQYRAQGLRLNGSAPLQQLQLDGSVHKLVVNDTISLPPVELQFLARNDSSLIKLRSGKGSGVEKLNLNALVKTYNDGFVLHWEPSDFTVNGKLWSLGEEGELVLRKSLPVSGNLLLAEGDQQVRLTALPGEGSQQDKISVDLANINLNDITPFVLPKNRLEGVLTGKIFIKDPVGELQIVSDQIDVQNVRLDNDSIGDISSTLLYDFRTGLLTAAGATRNDQEKLTFDIRAQTRDSLSAQNNISLQAQHYSIQLLERFLGDLFSDIQGYLTGDITIGGDWNRPAITGRGLLSDAGLRVNYTQCYYQIEDKQIELTPSRIELNGLVLHDTITGNPIYVTGGINHESFYNLFYDLDISTRKPGTRSESDNRPVLLLNTNRSDNNLYFGRVKGTALMQLRGPQSDMVMTLNATASEKDSSFVTLPPGTGRESGAADFLVERKFGTELSKEEYAKSGDNVLFDLELTANPMLQVKVVLDELTGDEIKGKGSGTLKIRSGTTEPLTLRGRLGVEEGDYLFTFQSFFKKPFEIKKGSNSYIEWNGDPYDANVKFEAVYKSDRVSFSPLASTLNLTPDISNARSDVYVVAKLSDKLFKPSITFSLDFPPNSVANVNPELNLLIRQLQNNPNELNRQVTYLIVFNSFAPNELGGSLSAAGVNVSTISGILLSVLSDQINKLFSNLLRSDKYRINLNTSLYNRNLLASSSTALSLGSNVNFSIGRSFFDNRFVISTGLGMDAPLGQGTQSSVQQSILLLPDVTMEWLINPSGTIRASFFYRTNADFLTASANATVVRSRRAGASLSYKRDYDRLGDFFHSVRRKKRNK